MQNPFPGSPDAPSPTPGAKPQAGVLNRLLERRPYTGTLLIFLYFAVIWFCFHFFGSPLFDILHMPFLLREIVAELLVFIAVVSVPIILLRWWSETGFTRGIDSWGVVISLIPLAIFVIPLLCSLPVLAVEATPSTVVMAIILALAVALTEEGFFRGVLLRALLPKGIWPSVIISSLLFTCVHLTNLISGFPLVYVIGQLVLTFGSGMLFATLRLRTRSIWPSILLHFLRDVGGLILLGVNPKQAFAGSLSAVLIVNGIFSLICIVNAVVLLRPSQVQKLRVTYGLALAPAIPPVFYYPAYPGQPPYTNYPYPQQPVAGYPGLQPPTTMYPNQPPPVVSHPDQQPPLIVYPDQQNPPGYPEQ